MTILRRKSAADERPRWRRLADDIERVRDMRLTVHPWGIGRPPPPEEGWAVRTPQSGVWNVTTGVNRKGVCPDDAERIWRDESCGPAGPLEDVEAMLAAALASPAAKNAERLSELAESFPCLRGQEGVRPWRPELIVAWLSRGQAGPDKVHAAQFLLAVADGRINPNAGALDVVAAFREWAEADRQAFLAWAQAPWWL